jgi:hypothetical protein
MVQKCFYSAQNTEWPQKSNNRLLKIHANTNRKVFISYSMQQSPSWEANRFAASQKISSVLWNPNVHYRYHKCPPQFSLLRTEFRARIAQSVWWIDKDGSKPGDGEIFRTLPDRPWGPHSLLHNGYRVFHGGKGPERGVNHPPHLAQRIRKASL